MENNEWQDFYNRAKDTLQSLVNAATDSLQRNNHDKSFKIKQHDFICSENFLLANMPFIQTSEPALPKCIQVLQLSLTISGQQRIPFLKKEYWDISPLQISVYAVKGPHNAYVCFSTIRCGVMGRCLLLSEQEETVLYHQIFGNDEVLTNEDFYNFWFGHSLKAQKQLSLYFSSSCNEVWTFPEGGLNALADMRIWFPLVKDLVPVPETIQVDVPNECNLVKLCDMFMPKHFSQFRKNMKRAVQKIGAPCFVRTGFTSNKHDWGQTCYFDSTQPFLRHIANLVEFSAMVDLPLTAFFVRKLIYTKVLFRAFSDMPITREFRFFMGVDGKIESIQPYWPKKAMQYWNEELHAPILQAASVITEAEYKHLAEMTCKLSGVLPNVGWSIDWLQDVYGKWWMIDMAPADLSYRWEPDFQVVVPD